MGMTYLFTRPLLFTSSDAATSSIVVDVVRRTAIGAGVHIITSIIYLIYFMSVEVTEHYNFVKNHVCGNRLFRQYVLLCSFQSRGSMVCFSTAGFSIHVNIRLRTFRSFNDSFMFHCARFLHVSASNMLVACIRHKLFSHRDDLPLRRMVDYALVTARHWHAATFNNVGSKTTQVEFTSFASRVVSVDEVTSAHFAECPAACVNGSTMLLTGRKDAYGNKSCFYDIETATN